MRNITWTVILLRMTNVPCCQIGKMTNSKATIVVSLTHWSYATIVQLTEAFNSHLTATDNLK